MTFARRIGLVAQAAAPVFAFIATWDARRLDPDVCDFAFGNPQELAGVATFLLSSDDGHLGAIRNC